METKMIQSVTPFKSIEVQDYLDATSDASNRTRSVIITMVVASVLIFGALINSFQHQWMLERLKALDSPQSPYTQKKIGPYPEVGRFPTRQAYEAAVTNYNERYHSFYDAVARSYVENALSTKVPLFGFSIDANDLGILGGIAFVVILIMYRFCLTREVENIRIAHEEAKRFDQLWEFYTVLSMRQVFTIPPSRTIKRDRLLRWTPKTICTIPLIIHSVVTGHDLYTNNIGKLINGFHNLFLFTSEFITFGFLVTLTIMAVTRLRRIDREWDAWWEDIQAMGVVAPFNPVEDTPQALAKPSA
jgi:hypothetical protein